jgi:hypothetical protein
MLSMPVQGTSTGNQLSEIRLGLDSLQWNRTPIGVVLEATIAVI